ncbi:uncharacterized protein TNCV_3572411 [Trichonephila clavipes]|nr:uncharacterized protein TNCV_3572411 [Trichonephila clavipes]
MPKPHQELLCKDIHFRTKFRKEPPHRHNISRWVKQFQDMGCLCKNKSPGRKETKPEVVERIRDSFLRSPSKSTRRAGAELTVPHTTVWRVLQKRLQFKPYRHQMVQALKPTDKPFRKNFCVKFQEHFDVNGFENTLVCTDEATFHLGGKLNRHNLRFGGMENVHVTLEHQRDSPKSFVKDKVFVRTLPRDLEEVKQRITAVLNSITGDMLSRVWQELDYRVDNCCVTGGAHIEHL